MSIEPIHTDATERTISINIIFAAFLRERVVKSAAVSVYATAAVVIRF